MVWYSYRVCIFWSLSFSYRIVQNNMDVFWAHFNRFWHSYCENQKDHSRFKIRNSRFNVSIWKFEIQYPTHNKINPTYIHTPNLF